MGVVVYKCLNCGGPLEFKASSQGWTCEYCLSDFSEKDMQSLISKEEEATAEELGEDQYQQLKEQDAEFNEKAIKYTCQSCAAEIVTDDTTAATFCYYCHNPTIIPSRLEGEYRPAKVIPFKFNQDDAQEKFLAWCKKKPLLSKYFTHPSQLEKLSGVYVPFWLFDCDTDGSLSAEASKTRTYRRGNIKYTETKYYQILREGTANFKGIPADGSQKIDEELMAVLEPYDYNDFQDFSMYYLSGYLAEKYSLNQNDVYGKIAKQVQKYTGSLLLETVKGYNSISVHNSKININKTTATYVLLPVWLFTYEHKGNTYIFAMNGQTGKIAGHLPISYKRAASWFGLISGASFIIMLLGGFLL